MSSQVDELGLGFVIGFVMWVSFEDQRVAFKSAHPTFRKHFVSQARVDGGDVVGAAQRRTRAEGDGC